MHPKLYDEVLLPVSIRILPTQLNPLATCDPSTNRTAHLSAPLCIFANLPRHNSRQPDSPTSITPSQVHAGTPSLHTLLSPSEVPHGDLQSLISHTPIQRHATPR